MSSSNPLVNRYLWAVGATAAQIPAGNYIKDRYQVIAPQIWLDTQPELPPEFPEAISGNVLPYLRLYPQRLHIPEVYGICQVGDSVITLLENVPIDSSGELLPSLQSMWSQASAVRQVYWLWQILELWTPLQELGVASSLLIPDNLRVEGGRVRLQELYVDALLDSNRELAAVSSGSGMGSSEALETGTSGVSTALIVLPVKATLQQLGEGWASLCSRASVSIVDRLQEIVEQLQGENPSYKAIATQLNQLLLEQAARQPLRIQVAGATDTGPNHDHNEDSCFPTMADLPTDFSQPRDPVIPHLSIICDGIGGHEGGEVASQLAVRSIQLQIRALLTELQEDPEIMNPDLVAQQLAAIIRVANNLISSHNDSQERESRRRMATTLTLALQLPQIMRMPDGQGNAHELYIASVGDSRAYWLTPRYCQQLTVDDDVATREVRMGRSVYRQALQRPDASALTQAVGTRDAELLRPTVRRFILEEDGLLLLCSDGLSDNGVIEEFCTDYPKDIFSGKISLHGAVQSLIELANQKNGHDNTSVVLTYCAVSPQYPVVLNLGELELGNQSFTFNLDAELAGIRQAIGSDEPDSPVEESEAELEAETSTSGFRIILGILGIVLILFSAGAALFTAQWMLNPNGFQKVRDRFFQERLQLPPTTPPDSQQ